MGNNSSPHNSNHSYVHPRLGHIRRLQHRNNHHSILYQIVLDNERLYADWIKELEIVRAYEGVQQILFLPTQHNYQQVSYCGTGGFAELYFEDYLYSLQPQITNRKRILRPFSEQQVVYLFYSLVKIQAILQSKNKFIGDIRPENILVNEQGYVKIISQYSWPASPNKFLGNWQKDTQRLFLSPEECEERYKRRAFEYENLNKNQCEVFSIGLTILEAGTLKDCSQIYGFTSQYRFNQGKMRELIDIFEQRYSHELTRLLKEMLYPNPRKRIKAQTVYKILRPFQYSILNLQEILIKLPQRETATKFDREQKISMKRVGESLFNSKENHENTKFQAPLPAATENSKYMKLSLGQNIHSSVPTGLYANNPQNLSGSLQNGSLQQIKPTSPNLQPLNYQMLNEYSSFSRHISSLPSLQKSVYAQEERQLIQSLPLNLGQYEVGVGNYKTQYLSQTSMVDHRASQEQHFINY